MSSLSQQIAKMSPLQLAMAAQKMRAKVSLVNAEPIAIIGMGCRFPHHANSPEAFWHLLSDGIDAVTEIPAERWGMDNYYDPDPSSPGKIYTRAAGCIDQVENFDAHFFNITPREAASMDPQQRLVLEVSWESLENAGVAPDGLRGSLTGVFIGLCSNDYLQRLVARHADEIDAYMATGNHYSVNAGRLSYILGLQGPSLAVDTACSSSLVSVHLACESLRNGECNLALAGGVNLLLSPEFSINYCKANMLSPDGRCKTFDAAANGFVRAEGCGIVVLKRLSDAVAAGDNVMALIRGSAVNQDGRTSGLTAPNGLAQQAVIRQALKNALVEPEQVQYIEVHGTGTSLGDPIEVEALGNVFAHTHSVTQPLYIGSAKTNLGHLEGAAGIAGLIKVVLSLQNQEIPPHLHFNEPNPHINWDALPVRVTTERMPWASYAGRQIAGVSAFGFSGTNAHVLIEVSPPKNPVSRQSIDRSHHLLTLSAKSEAALQAYAHRYHEYLTVHPDINLGDFCRTSHIGRSHFAYRLSVAADSLDGIQRQLASYVNGDVATGLSHGMVDPQQAKPKIALLFTGQGSQYIGMGRELYKAETIFRAVLDECDELLHVHLGESIVDILYSQIESEADNIESRIDQTAYTQPVLFALEYALAQLWLSWGILPDFVMGHSVGEIVAACVAGVFSLEDGIKLIAARGRLMQVLPQDGAMISLLTTEARAAQAVAPHSDQVAIAAVNGPENVVISGKRSVVTAIADQLATEGIKTRKLTVSHAFHSPLIEPILTEFAQVAHSITYHKPTMRLISNVTGQLATAGITTADYWVQHVRATVRFADGVQALFDQEVATFLEIGPQPTLLGMLKRPTTTSAMRYLPSLRKGRSDWQQLLISLGELYASGHTINWANVHQGTGYRKVVLPTYPFQRQRYWIDAPPHHRAMGIAQRNDKSPTHPLLGERLPSKKQNIFSLRPLVDKMIQSPAIKESIFQSEFSVDAIPFLTDHRVYGEVVAPGACQLAMSLNSAELLLRQAQEVVLGQNHTLQLEDLVLPQALVIPEEGTRTVQALMSPIGTNGSGPKYALQLISFDAASLQGTDSAEADIHVKGMVVAASKPSPAPVDLNVLHQRCDQPCDLAAFYTNLVHTQVDLGPSFRWIRALWQSKEHPTNDHHLSEAMAELQCPETISTTAGYLLHPGLIDACFQVAGATRKDAESETETLLPFALEALHLHQPATGNRWWCHAKQVEPYKWDLQLLDVSGDVVATMTGYAIRPATPAAVQRKAIWRDWLYEVDWQPQPLLQTEVDGEKYPTIGEERWLIFADSQGMGEDVATQLRGRGAVPILIYADATAEDGCQQTNEVSYHLHPERSDHYRQLLARVTAEGDVHGLVHLWCLDAPEVAEASDLEAVSKLGCDTALHLVQALLHHAIQPAGLWLVTRNAQAVNITDDVRGMVQSTLWGMGKVIALEHPELNCVCIDLDSGRPGDGDWLETQVAALCSEFTALAPVDTRDQQVALRAGQRYVARLVRYSESSTSPQSSDGTLALPDGPYRLEIGERGTLDNLHLAPVTRRPPAAHEIEVQVHASGLNFRDVLNVLGLYPGDPGNVGFECSGEVVAVGEDVKTFAIGDTVLGLAEGTFGQYVTNSAYHFTHRAESLSHPEAATIPVAFLTVYYGLYHLAKIQPNDRVLIHAATGGVGQAAVQFARHIGAELYCTASPGKWETLRAQGVSHIYNSRTTDFAEQIMADTAGQGVDLVLNSLTSEGFIEATLSVLAPNGRFVEIGKRDIWTAAEMGAVRPDVLYKPFDLGEVGATEPTLIAEMLSELMVLFAEQKLHPLPKSCFPLSNAPHAFRYMQQARHTGKIVITHPTQRELVIHKNATYLITGGMGGIGLEVAMWLAEQGAGQLILMGRSQPTPAVQAQLDALTAQGVLITVARADVTDGEQVRQILAEIDPAYPLRGILHAAAVLDDGVLLQQDWERFVRVLAPKMQGAWHLHEATKAGGTLDFFVLFSSAASLLGNRGQANYAAANAFLDAFAHACRAQGYPTLSINWGWWSEVGIAAALVAQNQQQLAARGEGVILPTQGIEVLAHLLHQDAVQVGVTPLTWSRYLAHAPMTHSYFSAFKGATISKGDASAATTSSLRQQLAEATSEHRSTLLMQYLQRAAAKISGLQDSAQIDQNSSLLQMGMDSLMLMELAKQLTNTLDYPFPTTLLFDYPTLRQLTDYICEQVLPTQILPAQNGVAFAPPPAAKTTDIALDEGLDFDPTELDEDLTDELEALEALLQR